MDVGVPGWDRTSEPKDSLSSVGTESAIKIQWRHFTSFSSGFQRRKAGPSRGAGSSCSAHKEEIQVHLENSFECLAQEVVILPQQQGDRALKNVFCMWLTNVTHFWLDFSGWSPILQRGTQLSPACLLILALSVSCKFRARAINIISFQRIL